jgi:hypothetical protein
MTAVTIIRIGRPQVRNAIDSTTAQRLHAVRPYLHPLAAELGRRGRRRLGCAVLPGQ